MGGGGCVCALLHPELPRSPDTGRAGAAAARGVPPLQRRLRQVLAVFSIAYAVSSPLAGCSIDRFGLNRSISVGVGMWSLAGRRHRICERLAGADDLPGGAWRRRIMRRARGRQGAAPYLPPKERALGNAVSQIGLSVGAILAPPLATWFALRHGWRSAFIFTGLAGLCWIPLWLWRLAKAPVAEPAAGRAAGCRIPAPRCAPVGFRCRQRRQHAGVHAVEQLDHALSERGPWRDSGPSEPARAGPQLLRLRRRAFRRMAVAAVDRRGSRSLGGPAPRLPGQALGFAGDRGRSPDARPRLGHRGHIASASSRSPPGA